MVEEPAALGHHLEKAPARVVVLLVRLEVFGQVRDALGEDRDLHFSAARVAFGAAMGLAPGASLFGKTAEGAIKRPISEALAQIFGVQPALGVGQRATQNAAAGRETTAEELLRSTTLAQLLGESGDILLCAKKCVAAEDAKCDEQPGNCVEIERD